MKERTQAYRRNEEKKAKARAKRKLQVDKVILRDNTPVEDEDIGKEAHYHSENVPKEKKHKLTKKEINSIEDLIDFIDDFIQEEEDNEAEFKSEVEEAMICFKAAAEATKSTLRVIAAKYPKQAKKYPELVDGSQVKV